MARTRVPTSLDEYQAFVRAEALKVQADMGWPDDKLNETLKALGLPQKLTFTIPVEVQGAVTMFLTVTDQPSEEAAKAQFATMTPDKLREYAVERGIAMPTGFAPTAAKVLDELPPLVQGGPDITLTNATIRAQNRGVRQCEQYNNAGTMYCTLPRGHEGIHARGDGNVIVRTWA